MCGIYPKIKWDKKFEISQKRDIGNIRCDGGSTSQEKN